MPATDSQFLFKVYEEMRDEKGNRSVEMIDSCRDIDDAFASVKENKCGKFGRIVVKYKPTGREWDYRYPYTGMQEHIAEIETPPKSAAPKPSRIDASPSDPTTPKRKAGRPKGSRNKPKTEPETVEA